MYTATMKTELTMADFRAHLKDYFDRAQLGETFTLRGGAIHLSSDSDCREHVELNGEESEMAGKPAG